MTTQERITAAAVRLHSGLVVILARPSRHHHICRALHAEGLSQGPSPTGAHDIDGQGFITSGGRFVDRKEGAAIAIAAGQIPHLRWPPDLYSEDLW